MMVQAEVALRGGMARRPDTHVFRAHQCPTTIGDLHH
jgi:hypothetical protein